MSLFTVSKCTKSPHSPQAWLASVYPLWAGWHLPTDPTLGEALLPAMGTRGPAGGTEGWGPGSSRG